VAAYITTREEGTTAVSKLSSKGSKFHPEFDRVQSIANLAN